MRSGGTTGTGTAAPTGALRSRPNLPGTSARITPRIADRNEEDLPIGLSIVMGIVFWFFLALTKSLGYLEILNPFLAAWDSKHNSYTSSLYLLFKLRT